MILRVVHRSFQTGVLCAIASLLCGLTARGSERFLVVEHVERLLLYNSYQQQASDAERKLLEPFCALRIVKPDALLADGFTRCMQVSLGGETFYLLTEQAGKPARSGPLGFEKTFRNATFLFDTVEVLKGRSVRFEPVNAPAGAVPLFPEAGERLLRIFSSGNRVYCRRPAHAEYGWAALTGKGARGIWKLSVAPLSRSQPIPARVIEGVRSRLDETNRLLSRLFEHFNAESHQQKEIPHWSLDTSRTLISCRLAGTSQPETFDQSTLYLVKDIENIVLGSGLKVSHTPGTIDIRRP